MSFFSSSQELQDELVAFLDAFVTSEDGARAAQAARELSDSATLVLMTVDPETVVSVDFLRAKVSREPVADPDVQIRLRADDLHNVLLHRLGPVEISTLVEDEDVAYAGDSTKLAGLFVVAGPMQPYYPATLERRGRADLLETPAPTTRRLSELRGGGARPMYGIPRPWQRQQRKRTRTAAA